MSSMVSNLDAAVAPLSFAAITKILVPCLGSMPSSSMTVNTFAVFAIDGTAFVDTNDPTSIVSKPTSRSAL